MSNESMSNGSYNYDSVDLLNVTVRLIKCTAKARSHWNINHVFISDTPIIASGQYLHISLHWWTLMHRHTFGRLIITTGPWLPLSTAYLQVLLLVHTLNALVGQGVHLQGFGMERHLHCHKLTKDFLLMGKAGIRFQLWLGSVTTRHDKKRILKWQNQNSFKTAEGGLREVSKKTLQIITLWFYFNFHPLLQQM